MKNPSIRSTVPDLRTPRTVAAALWLLGLVAGVSGCAAPSGPASGTITLNLTGQSPSGTVYRLRHAVISVTGPDTSRIWNTEDDPSRTSLSDNVSAGDYEAALAPGWNLERIEGSSATPVVAGLASDNPVRFTVSPQRRTIVPLRFHVDTDVVDMAQGYDLVLTIDESPPQLIVVANVNDFESGSITVHEAHASGDVAPLRTIAGPLTTLTFPAGIAVTDDEIIVCDQDISAIDVFPINASGNVAPTRQIVGSETGLEFCTDVAVFNGELYVAQLHDLLVFPITANGDAAPSRRITGFSIGQFLAIDHGELYVADAGASGGSVSVFTLPVAEDARPTRFIESDCASGITVADGELLVSNGCDSPGEISVYPATANGSVEPLRTLGGDRTGLDSPQQIRLVRGALHVADISADRVAVFRDVASGDAPPVRVIGGPHSGLSRPVGLAVR
ncbi:MAG TPA: hypothetical protein VHW23_18045 [Kofleriaceae bacterium]|jgi:hypothetical protein|nr:hypothetical protein [Kofleriaceae bacterium]